jgi:hypothetical protein
LQGQDASTQRPRWACPIVVGSKGPERHLVALGAHLLELWRKIRTSEDHYYIVQNIYLDWWIVGPLLPAALVADIVLALTVTDRVSWWLAVNAVALVGINPAAFAIRTPSSQSSHGQLDEAIGYMGSNAPTVGARFPVGCPRIAHCFAPQVGKFLKTVETFEKRLDGGHGIGLAPVAMQWRVRSTGPDSIAWPAWQARVVAF